MSAVEIVPVDGAALEADFAATPGLLRRDPYRIGLEPESHWQDYLHGPFVFVRRFWIARRDGILKGRVGANLTENRGGKHPGIGFVGFFEVDLEDPAASAIAAELLGAAEAWLRAQGATKLFGPVNLSTWLAYRFRVNEGDEERFAWEPTNPPEYPRFFEAAGFRAIEYYHTEGIPDLDGVVASNRAAFDKALAAGYTLRPFRAGEALADEVTKLHAINVACFGHHFLSEPLAAEPYRRVLVPTLVREDLSLSRFVVDPNGREVGYVFAFDDESRGQKYTVWKTIAVLPECRGMGLSMALLYEVALRARERGDRHVVAAMLRSGAQSESYQKKLARETWKHDYALFAKDLGGGAG